MPRSIGSVFLAGAARCCMIAAFATAVALPGAADEIRPAYGNPGRISGVYFTNFENSRFVECAGAACKSWARGEDAAVHCAPEACQDLERRIKGLNGSHDRWGTFAITFVGRKTSGIRKPRYLGDGVRDVLIERILEFKLIEGRPN